MEREFTEFKRRNPNRHNPLVYQLVIRVYMTSAQPSKALDFFNSVVSRGYKPCIEDVESLIFGLLRRSDEERALNYFRSLGEYGLKSRTATFNILIEYYLNEKQPNKARALFKEMEQVGLEPNQMTFLRFMGYFIGKADYRSAEKVKDYMRERKVKVDVRFYNGLIGFMKRNMVLTEVESLIKEMMAQGILPDINTYNLLLSAYARVNNHERISQLLGEMKGRGIPPTTQTFNRMLLSLSHSMTPEQTRGFLQDMTNLGLAFNSYTYAAIIMNLLRREKATEAVEMMFALQKNNVVLALESYGQLLQECCARRLEPAVLLLWHQMSANGIPPNHFIFNTLLDFFLMRQNFARVDSLLLEMRRKWGLMPNAYIYTALLNHYAEILDFGRLRAVIEMIREGGVEINTPMYNVMMKTFYCYSRYQQGGHITRLQGIPESRLNSKDFDINNVDAEFSLVEDHQPLCLSKMRLQFEKLFGLPFHPTVHIYNEMMLSFFLNNRFEEMFDCLREMRKADIVPNLTTYSLLLKAYVFDDQVEQARDLLQEMSRMGLQPTILHCAIFFHAHSRKLDLDSAESFLREMEDVYRIRPNHVFYASLIYAYMRRKQYADVFRTFERMERAGFSPDTETCNYVLISLMEINEFGEARRFLEKMIKQGIPRNKYTYSYLAVGCLAQGDEQGAIEALGDCIHPGNTVDCRSFGNVLRLSWEKVSHAGLRRVLMMMIDCCVPFEESITPYVKYTFEEYEKDPTALPDLIKLVKKLLVDVGEDSLDADYLTYLKVKLHTILVERGLSGETEEFEIFLNDLPELKRLWTETNSEVMDKFGRHVYLHGIRDPDDGNTLELEFIDGVREDVAAIAEKQPSVARDLFGLVKA